MVAMDDQETIFMTDFDALAISLELKSRIQVMGGTDFRLVMQKRLSKADTLRKSARFLIPGCDVGAEFLTEQEKKQLDDWDKGLPVSVIGPSSQSACPVLLKRKRLGNLEGESFELVSNWAEVLRRNRDFLRKGAFVQVWSFRCRSKLFLALVKVRGDGEGKDNADHPAGSGCDFDRRGEASVDLSKPSPTSCPQAELVLLKAGFLAYEFLTKGKLPNDDGISEFIMGHQKLTTKSRTLPVQTFCLPPPLAHLPTGASYYCYNYRPDFRPSGLCAPIGPLRFQARPFWIPTGAFAPVATGPLLASYSSLPAIPSAHGVSPVHTTGRGTHHSKKRKK